MQAVRIVLATLATTLLYGVAHDQITARISIEYFTVGHQRLFAHDSPTLHGLAWGVIATWWVGIALGAALALCARAGSRPRGDRAPSVPGRGGLTRPAAGIPDRQLDASGELRRGHGGRSGGCVRAWRMRLSESDPPRGSI
jgi:hypothetical protein